jgi:hypothetical protein
MSTPEGEQWDWPDGFDALSAAAEHHQLIARERARTSTAHANPRCETGAPSSNRGVGEARWPMTGAVSAAIALTFLLPATVRPGPNWLLPLIELLVPRALGATASVRVLYCGGGTATQTNP